MSLLRGLVTRLLKALISLACKVDSRELRKLPAQGPFIIVTNHVNFLEVPVIYCWLWPRKVHGMVKRETWKEPILGFLARLWEAIPVQRHGGDEAAMRKAAEILSHGGIVGIAPEGTRSGNGVLRSGHPGVVTLAVKSGAPIVAVAHVGGELFWENLRRLKRTRLSIRVGEPLRFAASMKDLNHHQRAEMLAEAMRELARLLPPERRGAYAQPDPATAKRKWLFRA